MTTQQLPDDSSGLTCLTAVVLSLIVAVAVGLWILWLFG